MQVRAQDGVGLWSEPDGSQQIIIDKTAPSTPEITTELFTNVTTQLSNIGYTAVDLESGVTHYLLSVVTEIDGLWLTTPEAKPIDQFSGLLTGVNLQEGDYYLVMKTKNGAGKWSEPGYSSVIKVDTTDPVLTFASADSELVFNQSIQDVEFSLDEPATVKFTLTSNTTGSSQEFTFDGATGTNYFSCDESTPDSYKLQAKPTQFSVNVSDPDGSVVDYEWDFGDETTSLEESPTHSYSGVREYTLTLKVTDNDGKSTTDTTIVFGEPPSTYASLRGGGFLLHRPLPTLS